MMRAAGRRRGGRFHSLGREFDAVIAVVVAPLSRHLGWRLGRRLCAAAVLGAASTLALAQPAAKPAAPAAPAYDTSLDCKRIDKEGGNNYEMGQCAGRARQAADAELNQVYGQLRAAIKDDEADVQALLQAQRAWLPWRDKESDLCARMAGFSPDGSGYSLVWAGCQTTLTQQRTQVLRGYLRAVTSR